MIRAERAAKIQQFGIWLGMPEGSREPKTQEELAKQLGLHKDTLTDWKKLPEVQEIARNALQLMALGSNLEIWQKTIEKAMEGNIMAMRLYYNLTNQLKPKEVKGGVRKFIVEYGIDGTES